MRATLRWIWHELVRPRGSRRHRFYRVGRSSRAGVALLMAVSSILLLTILVTEIAHGAVVRAQLAAQHRDEAKAEALAYSGAQFYRMILIASAAIGRNPMIMEVGQALGINATELWQAIPFVDTTLLRMLLVSGDSADEDDLIAAKTEGLTAEQEEESREGGSMLKRAFLDFDGNFNASVMDEDRGIYVGKFQAASFGDLLMTAQAQEIMALLSREQYQDWMYRNNIVKEELIANLADWTDPDDTRLYQGGSEDALYQALDKPYRSKNAPFDTRDEIRLVDGWHLDGVWERVGRHLTIYGSGKINVNTATQPVLRALLMAFMEGVPNENTVEPALTEFLDARGRPMSDGGLTLATPAQFEGFFEQQMNLQLRDEIQQAITTESKVFRITSAGEVGTARVEVHAILDFTDDKAGRIMFWRVR